MAEESLSLGHLRDLCEEYERTLRFSLGAEVFPEEWEQTLREAPATTVDLALRRFGALKAFTYAQHLRREKVTEEGATTRAAAALLRREAVRVPLSSGRTVYVTGRSLAALMEMTAHEAAMKLLESGVADGQATYEHLARARVGADRRRQRAITRRMKRVHSVLRDAYDLLATHRERWCAHLSTPSGAPASDGVPAPDWWRELTQLDLANLLVACYEAGPARYFAMGPAPAPKSGKPAVPSEWFGALSLLGAYGMRVRVPPAELLGRDYGQLLAELRLFPSPSLPETE
jgi:hypothetical protein